MSSSSSSTSMRRYHSTNDERDIDYSAGVQGSERQCKTQPCRTISNRLQQPHVLGDINDTTYHGSTAPCEALAEEELTDRLKEIINEFMTRPDRRYLYDTTLRWTVDHGNESNYSVVVYINQPANLF
ncbi:unnamed protein product [Adineta ricciae]|uniref:Uncharacterized protein n=1 Tax=Adineta ricciae TaxID=249248 RepID=A0A815VAG1_ADIRI|nr:unnamed protein product [Adineta ricciae]CAF1567468.1 unnamed protein product [Adineta ricciae]